MFFPRSLPIAAIGLALAACQTTGQTAGQVASFATIPLAGSHGSAPALPAPGPGSPSAMAEGPRAAPPIGFVDFCMRHRGECTAAETRETKAGAASKAPPVELTEALWHELNQVNDFVNRTVKPVSDLQLVNLVEWWSYPIDASGDCEDYALEKRRLLAERGWPVDALLISVVKQWNGEGHAVLTVVTDRGDLVLDNMATRIVTWDRAPYTWLMRQSRTDPMLWVKLNGEERPDRVASTLRSSLAEDPSGL